MVAWNDFPKQPRKSRPMVPLDAELTFPDPDPGPACGEAGAEALSRVNPDGPDRCPACGRPAFSVQASGVLDLVLVAQEALSDLQRCVEEGVLP